MSEREIRTAFEHLKEDVMSNVPTEERLDHITKRSTWVRPAFAAFAGAAAVALIVGAAVLAFRPDSDVDPAPPATVTPSTTVSTPTTSATVAPTTPPVAIGLDLTGDTWVLHGIDGITTSSSGTTILATTPELGLSNIARDQQGGIAYTDSTGLWWWQRGAAEPVLLLEAEALQLVEVVPTGDGPVAQIRSNGETRYVDLASGTDVGPVQGSVEFTEDFQVIRTAANGLSVRIAQVVAAAGDGGTTTVEEPARLIVERAGNVVLDLQIAERGQFARVHDFDGRAVIVSYGPIEPALPPETYLVIDLACSSCTETFVAAAANAALTGPDSEWTGEIDDFGDQVDPGVAVPDLRPGTVVVADPAATPAAGDGFVVVDVDRAVGDGSGGLIVQTGNTIGWVRPDAPAINLFNGNELYDEPVDLRLEDLAVIDGEAYVVFIAAGGQEEQRYEEVWTYRLATGAPTPIYRTGAYEGGIRRAMIQNDILVITRHAEGFSWFEFTSLTGEGIVVRNPYPAEAPAGFPLTVDQAMLSPNGSTLVFLESNDPAPPEDGIGRVDLVVWDLTGGVEEGRVAIELGAWTSDRLDYDGTGIVLGRIQWTGSNWEPGPGLRIDAVNAGAGTVTELPAAGWPSLIKLSLR